jgi:hypothetical protein
MNPIPAFSIRLQWVLFDSDVADSFDKIGRPADCCFGSARAPVHGRDHSRVIRFIHIPTPGAQRIVQVQRNSATNRVRPNGKLKVLKA